MRVGVCDGVGMGGCGQTAKNDGESHCECCLSVRVLSEQLPMKKFLDSSITKEKAS